MEMEASKNFKPTKPKQSKNQSQQTKSGESMVKWRLETKIKLHPDGKRLHMPRNTPMLSSKNCVCTELHCVCIKYSKLRKSTQFIFPVCTGSHVRCAVLFCNHCDCHFYGFHYYWYGLLWDMVLWCVFFVHFRLRSRKLWDMKFIMMPFARFHFDWSISIPLQFHLNSIK